MIFVEPAFRQTISVSKQQSEAVLYGKRTKWPVAYLQKATLLRITEDAEDSFFTEHHRRGFHVGANANELYSAFIQISCALFDGEKNKVSA